MGNYYISDGTKAIGPYSAEQLLAMKITGAAGVRPEDDVAWQRADEVEELRAALIGGTGAEVGALAGKQMYWAPVKDDGYIKPGHRKFSAQLMDIPDGQDWEDSCAVMPNWIGNHYFPHPTRCINHFGMWGEWDVPDPAFADTFNALVFLYPDIPAVPLIVTEVGLGHIGWGFRLDDGRWVWGATELSLPYVNPGDPNGVFIEHGTREQMMDCFRHGIRKDGHGLPWKYFSYKALRANNPRGAHAESVAQATRKMGYAIVGNNCMTHSLTILNEYAGYPIVPLPILHPVMMIPRVWFTMINATEYHVNQNFWEVGRAATAE